MFYVTATIAIGTTNGTSTVIGEEAAAWDATVVECHVVPECSPKDVDRTRMTGGVVVIGEIRLRVEKWKQY